MSTKLFITEGPTDVVVMDAGSNRALEHAHTIENIVEYAFVPPNEKSSISCVIC